jgi:hypothetical protein
MVLNSLSSALSFTTIKWIEIPVGIINLFCVILVGLREIYQLSERAETNRESYKKWNKFSVEIQSELFSGMSLTSEERITELKKRYIELIDESPSISDKVIKKYKRKILNENKNKIYLPDIIDGLPISYQYQTFDIADDNV